MDTRYVKLVIIDPILTSPRQSPNTTPRCPRDAEIERGPVRVEKDGTKAGVLGISQ